MLNIDVKANGIDKRFMTNNDGSYFFVLQDGAAKQLSCESGFNSLRRIKKAIKRYCRFMTLEPNQRLSYHPIGNDWKA